MERLTRRMGRSWSVIPGCDLRTVEGMQAVVDRLAAYEDTGLTPEDIDALQKREQGLEAETMRLIDIDFLISEIKSHNDMNDRSMSWATWQVIELLQNCPMPPNDPLTLEELRKMDGEPVFIIPTRGSGGFCTWMLVDTKYDLCREVHGEMAVFENCGKTWLAYRRKPEENT